MTRTVLTSLTLAALLLTTTFSQGKDKAAGKKTARVAHASQWDALVDEFYGQYFKFHPTDATITGFHEHDGELEDFSRAGVDEQVAWLKAMLPRVEKFPVAKLNSIQRGDRELLMGDIHSELLELEEIRPWEKNPDLYSSGISYSAFCIMSRNYASQEERLRSLIAREKKTPQALAAARQNLKNPPQVYTQVALLQLPGNIDFFKNDVPKAFDEVKDPALLAEFKQSTDGVIQALEDYEAFLKKDVLPNSNGDFRIGAENFRKKLLYDEMVDVPLDELLKVGMADLHKNQQWYKETAAMLDPTKTPQQILDELGKQHPKADELLDTFRKTLTGLRDYCEQQHIITIPRQQLPIVEETPPFARALTFASMDTPGPYETKATEGYFNVTLPDASDTPEQVEEHMQGFNYGTVISTAVHEVYPGHYVQYLFQSQFPTKVRKLISANTDVEGWAHYTEQMMLDEGYGRNPKLKLADDKQFLKLRLGQLQDALLRDARFIVGIKMHTGQMSFDQGVEFFVNEGYQTHISALKETRRGTADPTYLVYTLGKLEIMKLRADYKKKMGGKFSLEEFHDRFMRQGLIPIKIIRQTMLGDDSPTL
jgi:uncharacterized protein (DUF885 family)